MKKIGNQLIDGLFPNVKYFLLFIIFIAILTAIVVVINKIKTKKEQK